MIHIHWYTRVGPWDGYFGLKRCRCGEIQVFDLYGLKEDIGPREYAELVSELKGRAGIA